MHVKGNVAFPSILLQEQFPASEPGSCLLCCANVRRDIAPLKVDLAGCAKRSVFLKNLVFQLGLDTSFLPEECSQSSFPLCCSCEKELSLMWTFSYEMMTMGIKLQNKISTCWREQKRYVPKQENGEFTKLREVMTSGAPCNFFLQEGSSNLRFLNHVINMVLVGQRETRNPSQPSAPFSQLQPAPLLRLLPLPPPPPPPFLNPFLNPFLPAFLNPFYATADTFSPSKPYPIPTTCSNKMGTEASVVKNNDAAGAMLLAKFLMCKKCGQIYQSIDQKLYDDHVMQCEAENEYRTTAAVVEPMVIPLFQRQSLVSFDQFAALKAPLPPVPPPTLLRIEDATMCRSLLKYIECDYCQVPSLGQKEHDDHLRQCWAARIATNENKNQRFDARRNAGNDSAQATPKAKKQSNPTQCLFQCTCCSKRYDALRKQHRHERKVHNIRKRQPTSSNGTPGGGDLVEPQLGAVAEQSTFGISTNNGGVGNVVEHHPSTSQEEQQPLAPQNETLRKQQQQHGMDLTSRQATLPSTVTSSSSNQIQPRSWTAME